MERLVTRAQWGARNPKSRHVLSLPKPSTGHWNGPTVLVRGKTEWDHDICASLVRGIQNFHMDGRGWIDIAYNFIVCPHGYTFEGRGLSVVNAANGTNIGNRSSHAIMCLGGEDNPFLDPEKQGFRECVSYIADKTTAPDECVGHRDHKSTECPGNARYNWIHKGMPIDTPSPGHVFQEDDMKTWFVRGPKGDVYVFDGVVLRPANNQTYRDVLKFHGTLGDPWFNWSQAQIDAVPKAPGN